MSLALRLALIWVCLLVSPVAAQFLSPGPLHETHATLGDDEACSQCHAQGKQVVAGRCLACHKPLAARVTAKQGLHGVRYAGQACEGCHVEHVGPKAPLIRWPNGGMAQFDHNMAGWPLQGAHKVTACAKCHVRKTSTGRATFLGEATACVGCHEDPHKSRYSNKCESCHNETNFQDFRQIGFPHELTQYPLKGKHAEVACAKCHRTPDVWKGVAFASCESCHADPHRGRLAPTPCAKCHDERAWGAAKERMREPGLHPGVGLDNGHRKVACATCHDRGLDRAPARGKTCVACHAPVHRAPFGHKCETCHGDIAWLGVAREVALQAHARTRYPLAGAHLEQACVKCHKPERPRAARFRDVPHDACGRCHADRHGGAFRDRDCAACHAVEGFAPTTFGEVAHRETRLPLDGKHLAVPCRACHKSLPERAASRAMRRTTTISLEAAGRTCATCHANPHGTQFATEIANGGCEGCHVATAWQAAKIDHAQWPLTGAHAQATCAQCHGGEAGKAAPRYRGTPRRCEGCHDDPHAAQFQQRGAAKPCDACHATDRFTLAAFPHEAQTGMALRGKHAAAACAACHPKTTLRNGVEVTAYRLGYRRCRDCHADPHAAKEAQP